MIDFVTIVGIIGTGTILLAFFMNQIGRWSREDFVFDTANALGSGILVVYAWFIGSVPFLVLNATWFLVSIKDVLEKRE
jgi:hypothetical protein